MVNGFRKVTLTLSNETSKRPNLHMNIYTPPENLYEVGANTKS